jgi:hypothetical protein
MADEPSAELFNHVNRSVCASVVADSKRVCSESILRFDCLASRHCRNSVEPVAVTDQMGSTPAATAKVREDSWRQVLAFVDRHLRALGGES